MSDITQTDRENVAKLFQGTDSETTKLRDRILSGKADGRVAGLLNQFYDKEVQDRISLYHQDSPEIKQKKDTLKIGDRVYMPKLGDTPNRSGTYEGYQGTGDSTMARIRWKEHYSSMFPLRYVELCPPKPEFEIDGPSVILVLMFILCIIVFGVTFW